MTFIKKNSKCVIVLGMHRSGTSVLTHAIETLGAHLGSKLMTANFYNEKGYFENKAIVDHNDEILISLGCRWDSICIPDFTEQQKQAHAKSLAEILSDEYQDIDFWGIKDPRLIRLNNIWQLVFEKLDISPYYLLANRNPFEVANSLFLRDKTPISIALLLWVKHQVDALALVLEQGGLVIDYDNMLSDPKDEINRLAKFLKIDPRLHEKKITGFAEQFVNADLKHSINNWESATFPGLEALCHKIYQHLNYLATLPINLILDKDQVSKSQKIIAEAKEFFTQNEAYIIEISNIKSIHDKFMESQKCKYEEKLNKIKSDEIKLLQQEISILKSRINWITSRPLYVFFKRIKNMLS